MRAKKHRITLRNELSKDRGRRSLQFRIPGQSAFKKATALTLRHPAKDLQTQLKDILVVFCGDRESRRVKKLFWGRPKNADVISFAYDDPPLIEILINVEQAKRQAPWDVSKEILFLYIHGLLHILGHDDNSRKKRAAMLKLGEGILNQAI